MAAVRRRLFHALTLLSLLLCAAVCAMWVRSFHRLDAITHISVDAGKARARAIGGWAECGGVALVVNYRDLSRRGTGRDVAPGFSYWASRSYV